MDRLSVPDSLEARLRFSDLREEEAVSGWWPPNRVKVSDFARARWECELARPAAARSHGEQSVSEPASPAWPWPATKLSQLCTNPGA